MIQNRNLKSRLFTVAALAFAFTLPVAGQGVARERSWNRDRSRSVETGATKVIAIQVWADPIGTGREQRFGVAPENEAVQVRPGERLRLTLVGTGLFDGEGEEVPVAATFNLEAGRDVTLLRSGSNWVEVEVGDGARGVAGQIGFRVRSGYDMRGGLTSGRITLEATHNAQGLDRDLDDRDRDDRDDRDRYDRDRNERDRYGNRYDDERWQTARLVTRALIEGILDTTFDRTRDRDEVEEIYFDGYRGVQQYADELASAVERRRGVRIDPEETVRRLYRVLLKRSPDQIRTDRGFYSNVESMRRKGLRSVVRTIVGSVEFRRVHDMNDFERLRRGGRRY